MRLVFLFAVSAALLAVFQPAFAQTEPQQRGTIQDHGPKQEAPPNPSNKSLSEKLKDSKGVIKPPPAGDPEIHIPAPAMPGNKMPVIVPPLEPGKNENVQPK